MLRRLLFLVLLFLPLSAFAQTGNVTLDGDWNGTLDTPGGRHLHMLFRFSHADGALQAQFVSVDQAGAVFPARVTLDGRHITLAMAFGGTFEGVVAEDGKSIAGRADNAQHSRLRAVSLAKSASFFSRQAATNLARR